MAEENVFEKGGIYMMNEIWVKILVVVVFMACGYFYGLSHKVNEKKGGLKTPMIVIMAIIAGCAGWFLLGLENIVWQIVIVLAVLLVGITFDRKLYQVSFAVTALCFIKLLLGIAAKQFGFTAAAWWIIMVAVVFAINLFIVYSVLSEDEEKDITSGGSGSATKKAN